MAVDAKSSECLCPSGRMTLDLNQTAGAEQKICHRESHVKKIDNQQICVGTRTGSAIGEPLSISADELRRFSTGWRLANLDETTITRDIENAPKFNSEIV